MTDVKHDIDALAGERWFPLETTITEDMSSIWGCLLYTSPSPRD